MTIYFVDFLLPVCLLDPQYQSGCHLTVLFKTYSVLYTPPIFGYAQKRNFTACIVHALNCYLQKFKEGLLLRKVV